MIPSTIQSVRDIRQMMVKTSPWRTLALPLCDTRAEVEPVEKYDCGQSDRDGCDGPERIDEGRQSDASDSQESRRDDPPWPERPPKLTSATNRYRLEAYAGAEPRRLGSGARRHL